MDEMKTTVRTLTFSTLTDSLKFSHYYSQIMSPRPPLPRKVGGHDPPSSYGSAAPARATLCVSAVVADVACLAVCRTPELCLNA